jgi:hypothetical protein
MRNYMTENVTSCEGKRLATVRQMPKFYPAFTQSSIRWLIFNERQNGFCRCIRRIGKKDLIDLTEFET